MFNPQEKKKGRLRKLLSRNSRETETQPSVQQSVPNEPGETGRQRRTPQVQAIFAQPEDRAGVLKYRRKPIPPSYPVPEQMMTPASSPSLQYQRPLGGRNPAFDGLTVDPLPREAPPVYDLPPLPSTPWKPPRPSGRPEFPTLPRSNAFTAERSQNWATPSAFSNRSAEAVRNTGLLRGPRLRADQYYDAPKRRDDVGISWSEADDELFDTAQAPNSLASGRSSEGLDEDLRTSLDLSRLRNVDVFQNEDVELRGSAFPEFLIDTQNKQEGDSMLAEDEEDEDFKRAFPHSDINHSTSISRSATSRSSSDSFRSVHQQNDGIHGDDASLPQNITPQPSEGESSNPSVAMTPNNEGNGQTTSDQSTPITSPNMGITNRLLVPSLDPSVVPSRHFIPPKNPLDLELEPHLWPELDPNTTANSGSSRVRRFKPPTDPFNDTAESEPSPASTQSVRKPPFLPPPDLEAMSELEASTCLAPLNNLRTTWSRSSSNTPIPVDHEMPVPTFIPPLDRLSEQATMPTTVVLSRWSGRQGTTFNNSSIVDPPAPAPRIGFVPPKDLEDDTVQPTSLKNTPLNRVNQTGPSPWARKVSRPPSGPPTPGEIVETAVEPSKNDTCSAWLIRLDPGGQGIHESDTPNLPRSSMFRPPQSSSGDGDVSGSTSTSHPVPRFVAPRELL